jgi:hypothetical protein
MRKHKSVVAILLGIMMVFTFMPTMAFAVDGADDAPKTGGHSSKYYFDGEEGTDYITYNWDNMNNDALNTVPADMQGMTVLKAPTCDEEGVGVIKCDVDLNGTACGAERVVWIEAKGHKAGRKIRVTAEALMDSLNMTAAEKAEVRAANDFCECYVYQCANGCGKYVKADGTAFTKADMYNFDEADITEHTAPAGTTKCASSFECTVCKVKGVTNSKFNQATADAFHWARNEETGELLNATESTQDVHTKVWTEESRRYGDVDYKACVRFTKTECDYCGAVLDSERTIYGYNVDGAEEAIILTEDVPRAATNKPELDHGTNTSKVIKAGDEATCQKNSHWTEVCNECLMETGKEGDNSDIKKHDFSLVVTPWLGDVPAPDLRANGVIYTATVCKYCGKLKADSVAPVGFTADHDYSMTYEKFTDANCEQGTWLKVTYKDGDTVVDEAIVSDYSFGLAEELGLIVKIDGKYYTTYDKKEIPYVEALGHEFGAIEAVADATCEEKALEGKICSKCHKVDHATVKEVGQALGHEVTSVTVAPTCGAYGYTYDTCSRCKEVELPEGILDKDWTWMYVADAQDTVPVYALKDPVVSLGTECDFAWKVLTPATDTKDGLKALVCTKCNAVKAGSETVIPADLATAEKKEAVEAATPVVEAAADILDNSKVYTAKSVAAIQEAKDMLNSAIASGTAYDVKAMTEKLQKAVAAAEEKAANTMKASGKTVTAKANSTKTFKKAKAFNVKKAKGKVTFAKKSGNAKILVSKAGKVTVKKGLKKNRTYKVKVAVTAAGNDNYLAKTKVVTLNVKVK